MHELAGVYALDALPEDERAFFERHLDTCESCARDVDEHRETAALLGSAVAEPPPADLRDRLLAQVAVTPQQAPARPVPATTAMTGMTGRARPLAAVAAALLAAVLGMSGVAVYLLGGTSPSQVALDTEFLATAEAVRLDAPAGTSATFYRSEEHDQGWLVVAGLDELEPGLAYQLWLFHDGSPVPAGVFDVDAGRVVLRADAQVRGAEVVAVTIEPAGGLPEPSGPIVMNAALGSQEA